MSSACSCALDNMHIYCLLGKTITVFFTFSQHPKNILSQNALTTTKRLFSCCDIHSHTFLHSASCGARLLHLQWFAGTAPFGLLWWEESMKVRSFMCSTAYLWFWYREADKILLIPIYSGRGGRLLKLYEQNRPKDQQLSHYRYVKINTVKVLSGSSAI